MALHERLDHGFAVFNSHINRASARADREFEAQFGREIFEKHIKPFHDEGIMAIFHGKPTIYTMAWVVLCTAYVNEKVPYRLSQLRRERGEKVTR